MPNQQIFQIGILLIFLGVAAVLFSAFSGAKEKDSSVKFSFFGLIGPVPFGFGNDKKLFLFTMIMTAFLVAAVSLLMRNWK